MLRSLEEPIHDHEVFDAYTTSAALWIAFAGQDLYTQVVEAPPHEDKGICRPGELYHGPEVGLERWKFWRQGLATAGENKRKPAKNRGV